MRADSVWTKRECRSSDRVDKPGTTAPLARCPHLAHTHSPFAHTAPHHRRGWLGTPAAQQQQIVLTCWSEAIVNDDSAALGAAPNRCDELRHDSLNSRANCPRHGVHFTRTVPVAHGAGKVRGLYLTSDHPDPVRAASIRIRHSSTTHIGAGDCHELRVVAAKNPTNDRAATNWPGFAE